MNPGRAIIALQSLRVAAGSAKRPLAFMEVCGTHTMAAFRSGLRSLLPASVRLISGPGCPVCVTAQGEIDALVGLARRRNVTICTYGDMLRVPGRVREEGKTSLEVARGAGADVRVIYSALDALAWARKLPEREVVLAGVGFETTAPATAAVVLQARREGLGNFSVLASHKLVVPAMLALLAGGQVQIDGFLCPGHVSAVIGTDAYRPVVEHYRLPCVIGGFEEEQMARALARLAELAAAGRAELVNEYPEAVSAAGNTVALGLMAQVFTTAETRWRGLGEIADSGLVFREEFGAFDARRRFKIESLPEREIPGCICGQVITGVATPGECKLFGRACTPVHPIGPCMVSSEGTCQAHFKFAQVEGLLRATT